MYISRQEWIIENQKPNKNHTVQQWNKTNVFDLFCDTSSLTTVFHRIYSSCETKHCVTIYK